MNRVLSSFQKSALMLLFVLPSTTTIVAKQHSLRSKRIQPLPSFILKWPWAIFKADYHDIKSANGMDAYFFVRYLRMMVKIFIPIWFFSWAILLPVDSAMLGAPSKGGLDQFTFGNITTNQQSRYAAHLLLAWGFTSAFFLFLVSMSAGAL